jgi:hypothetical protein
MTVARNEMPGKAASGPYETVNLLPNVDANGRLPDQE